MKRNARLRCPFRKGACEITRKTRRQCQACRLRKCLESGMRKESEWWERDGEGAGREGCPAQVRPGAAQGRWGAGQVACAVQGRVAVCSKGIRASRMQGELAAVLPMHLGGGHAPSSRLWEAWASPAKTQSRLSSWAL